MKSILNNKESLLRFVKDNNDFTNIEYLSMVQIGAESSKLVIANVTSIDCFTALVSVVLEENYTPNGMYTISLIDSGGDAIINDTAIVSGMNEDNKRQYIIEEGLFSINNIDLPLDLNANL